MLPLALGGCFVLIAGALALVAIAGAVTGKGRVQRAADLAAISAARSMRDDLPRLLSPPTLPERPAESGPHGESRSTSGGRGRRPTRAARANGVGPAAPAGRLPGHALLRSGPGEGDGPRRAEGGVDAEAGRGLGGRRSGRAAGRCPSASMPSIASGGGYSGPLVYRQGEGMRPDVAAAFDRMAAAAAGAGVALLVNSGFRSDAEQAALFAAHPDPQLGRAAGPLAAPLRDRARSRPRIRLRLARRQRLPLRLRPALLLGGLALRLRRRPAALLGGRRRRRLPAGGRRGGDGALSGGAGLPGFVPARFRAPLLRAAARWNVSAALLAAQLMAESNFNPFADLVGRGRRGSRSSSPARRRPTASTIPSTRSRRSRPRRT